MGTGTMDTLEFVRCLSSTQGREGKMTDPPPSQDIPSFYVNVVEMQSQPFDLIMTFGTQSLADTSKHETKNLWRPSLRIQMSHAHAKTMLPMLAKMLADYEARFGTIPAPGFDQLERE